MFSLFAGRLKLRYDIISHQWLADVIVGPKKEHSETIELSTRDLKTAKESALIFYKQFKAKHRPNRATCWDCQQYQAKARICSIGVPECRNTGGRYAISCDLFLPVKD
ncbi:MAG: hypothetical protein ACO3N6_03740 [bacterium]|jgi:hypothetical protein